MLALVYGHPLVAFVVLDRELKRSRPAWRAGYRLALLAVPGLLLLLVGLLSSAPHLGGDDPITTRIAHHAGSDLLAGVSSHLLVATHTFLEMLHYGVWLVAIPLASLRDAPWRVSTVPIARNSRRWRGILQIALGVRLAAVVLLWVAFLADYPTTRDVYLHRGDLACPGRDPVPDPDDLSRRGCFWRARGFIWSLATCSR